MKPTHFIADIIVQRKMHLEYMLKLINIVYRYNYNGRWLLAIIRLTKISKYLSTYIFHDLMKKYYTGEMIQFGNTLMITSFSFVISFTLDNIKRCQFLQTKQFLHGLLPKFLFCYKLQLFFGTPISILLLFIFFFDKRLSQFIPPLTI